MYFWTDIHEIYMVDADASKEEHYCMVIYS